MANPKWEETQPVEAPQGSAPKWEETQPIEEAQPPTSIPEAAALGLTDLAGFGPRIAAAAHTAMDATSGTKGIKELWDEYNHKHDELRSAFERAKKDHPYVYGGANLLGTGAALTAAGPAALTAGGLAATGALMGAGQSQDLTNIPDAAKNAAVGAVTSLAGGKAIEAAAPLVGKALTAGAKGVGDYLGNKAASMAEAATGATGKAAEGFVPGTGRYLLDNGIVNFGSSAKNVAENASNAMDESGQKIADILDNKLKDTSVDRNSVIKYIQDKIDSMAGNESKDDLVAALQKKQEQISGKIQPGLTEETANSSIPISKSEEIRRGFDKNAKWNINSDATNLEANKVAANGYREAGVDTAMEADPAIGQQFKDAKNAYHVLNPVEEAASKRASQLNQSPIGGALDTVATGVAGIPGAIGRRVFSPRLASAGAVSADKLSNIVSASPHLFGEYASVLTKAAARGATSLNATDYLLQQRDPAYRDQRDKVFNPKDEPNILSSNQ